MKLQEMAKTEGIQLEKFTVYPNPVKGENNKLILSVNRENLKRITANTIMGRSLKVTNILDIGMGTTQFEIDNIGLKTSMIVIKTISRRGEFETAKIIVK